MAQRTILVGIDFSPSSSAALDRSRWLAEALGYSMQFVHIIAGPASEWSPDVGQLGWLRSEVLDRALIRVRQGIPWVELVRAAQDCNAHLIVMGSHGASGFQPVGLGSTAARVAASAECPVVVVSGRAAAIRAASRRFEKTAHPH